MVPLVEALTLAAHGIPVFPCYPDGHGQRPDGRPYYKSPRIAGWQINASADEARIRSWWAQWPDSLVAVPTGRSSGLYVLDLDVKPHKGINGADTLGRLGLVPPPTRINWTLSGGMHLLYAADAGGSKTDSEVLGPGVDRRGDGGYVIWWPAHGGSVTLMALAQPPEWMRVTAREVVEDDKPPIGLTVAELNDLMRRIHPATMESRSAWVEVGMALHHETEGGDHGLDVWDAWSQVWPKYEGRHVLEREWSTFGRSRNEHKSIRSYMPQGWTRLPQEVFAGGAMPPVMPGPGPGPGPGPSPSPVEVTMAQAAQGVVQMPPEVTDSMVPAIPFVVPPLPAAMVDARDGTQVTRPLSELGNALRLHDRYRDMTRYVPELGHWLHWVDGAWYGDPDGSRMQRMTMSMSHDIYAEGAVNIHEAMLYTKWARKTHELRCAKNCVQIYATFEDIRLPVGLLDNDTMLVGLNRGREVIDLRTGTIRPARQDDYVTKSLGVSAVGRPDGSPRWLQFIDEVFNGDRELIDWMQRWCGYVLTGDTREEFFVFAYGAGRNGKGTFSETLRYIMGEYSQVVAKETLAETRRAAGGASADIAALAGARLAMSAETGEGRNMDEGQIKTFTGGDAITARKLYADMFEFMPQFKLFIAGNHKPIISGTDIGIWSRVRLVPFLRIFDESRRDSSLKARFKQDAPHILAWMLQGCLAWQQRGLSDTPKVVRDATREYKTDMDVIGAWIDDCIVTDASAKAPATLLYANYRNWAINNGYKIPMTAQAFGRKLTDRGFVQSTNGTVRSWCGLTIRL